MKKSKINPCSKSKSRENQNYDKFKQSGFTLIEIIIVVAIFATLMTVVTIFALNVANNELFFTESVNSEAELRQAYKIIVIEMRSMSLSNAGSYPISGASSSSFTFFSDNDSDGYAEKIRYFVDGNVLKRGVIKPSGNPLNYNPSDEKITETVHYLTSDNVFSYFDSNYDGSQSALGYPMNISSIKMVKLQLSVDKDLKALPDKVTVPVYIDLRNLRGI